MVDFGTEVWVQALREAINASAGYADAAKTWEGDFYFIVDPKTPGGKEIVMYVDLWHGKCREASLLSDRAAKQPAFVISAPEVSWRKVIEGKLDPIQGMMTKQLKLSGDMVKIMKAVKAAKELVACTTRVPTKFSD
jgi:putative sterol carrier protein